MKLELRDVKIKCKKLRRNNMATGSLKKDGQIIPVAIKGSDIDQYRIAVGLRKNISLEFEGADILVKVLKVERHPVNHNITNIDFEIAV